MKEEIFDNMIYKPKWEHLLIAQGTYNGLDYYVISLGHHPCAYVDTKEPVDVEYIDCHGGITYVEDYIIFKEVHLISPERVEGHFIGWDYAHFGDYTGDQELFEPSMRTVGDKVWKVEEIVRECKRVIDQVVLNHG